MKSLYITSVERYSGKTATCLALGMKFKAEGYKVGYLKPLSLQPWRTTDPDTGEVHIADEDAAFVREVLELEVPSWELSPVVITPEYLSKHLLAKKAVDLMDKVQQAYDKASKNQDILLLEGGGSLREGYVAGLPTPEVARKLGSKVLAVIKYRDEVRLMDDALTSQARLGESLCGVLLNRVTSEASRFVNRVAVPYLERCGIRVMGVLPERHNLAALSVGELIHLLDAEVLTKFNRPSMMVENLTVGAMTAEAALSRFRRYPNKAVITGGDRTDIQLAALETSTACLILTGNLRPSPLVVKQAEEFGVSIMLVRANTMEAIEAIERVYGRTRLGEAAKLKEYQKLMGEHVNYTAIFESLGLK